MAAAFEPETPEKRIDCLELTVGFRFEVDPVRPHSRRRRPELNDLLQHAGRHVMGRCAFGEVQRGACALDFAAAQLTRSSAALTRVRGTASPGLPRHSESLPRYNGARDFGERGHEWMPEDVGSMSASSGLGPICRTAADGTYSR